jgi:hypothetical protein
MVKGNVKDSSNRLVDKDVLSIAGRFGRSKLGPIPAIIVDIGMGKGYVGQNIDRFYALNQVVPLALSDIKSVMEEQGIPVGTIFATLGIFGMGLQTYNDEKRK